MYDAKKLVNIISIAGSDRGADTAIVARTTFSSLMFSRDSAQRFQIMEIIAMPRVKKWYKTIGVGEVFIKEIEKGEVLKPSPESMWKESSHKTQKRIPSPKTSLQNLNQVIKSRSSSQRRNLNPV